ncbi:hypothetical protein QTO34_016210 [Cnephaeus nilssonii]|uniref:G-protein coupled receptors family 1 profile domain-containing protein n=1 Tax=Cnephaeus nilssonii TaxID=3371016 RepID=A0AA40I6I4_CNENI|nr:hypothetical protein QTO34_016210 [Eptesicus nilssonii]
MYENTMGLSIFKILCFCGCHNPSAIHAWKEIIEVKPIHSCIGGRRSNSCVLIEPCHPTRQTSPSSPHSLMLHMKLAEVPFCRYCPLACYRVRQRCLGSGLVCLQILDWFIHTCMAAKSLTTVAMAKVCFMYARDPAKQVSIHSCTIWSVLAAIWAVASLLPLPECFFSTTRLHAGVEMCLVDVPAVAEVFMSIFGKLYPLLVFCLPLFFASFYFWRAYGQCQRRGTKTRHLRNQMRSKRLTVMLLSMATTSAVLWLPEWVAWLWMWHLKAGSPTPPQGFIALSQVLMFSISSANPLIFLVMSGEFKESLKGLWKWMITKKHAAAAESEEPPAGDSEALPDNLPSPESPVSIPEEEKTGSPASRRERSQKAEMPILPDVEQFWHERDTNPCEQDNDPIPWEHEDQETGDCEK